MQHQEITDSGVDRLSLVYVEDDERLASLTMRYLETHGVDTVWVQHGDQALTEVVRVQPDVILLDLMLPGTDGLALCRQLRSRMDTPIIMVTARGEEADRVLGLEGGADDYVVKPFSGRELVARVRAQARRARGLNGPQHMQLVIGDLVIDTTTMNVELRGEPLQLTSYEFGLLKVLAEQAGRVLSREQLLVRLHGSAEEAFDRSIDVHVSRLRHKLESNPRRPQFLKTIRGAGYMLVKPRG